MIKFLIYYLDKNILKKRNKYKKIINKIFLVFEEYKIINI